MKLSAIGGLFNTPFTKDVEISDICIDSRKVQKNSLFVAIVGEKFDGHNFINDAIANGAMAIICNKKHNNSAVSQIIVHDTLDALARLASFHRRQFFCPAIALTGSNGKTTVKEMIGSILPAPSHKTSGNLNNHIGVPLSVLKLNKEHKYAVFELGASNPREIAFTVNIVKPCVTLINNIAPAHLLGFSSIDGVAQAKGEIHQGLSENGTAIINYDDSYKNFWDNALKDKKVLSYSLEQNTDIKTRDVILDDNGLASFKMLLPIGEINIKLKVPGMHNVSNAIAAAAATYALGIGLDEIKSGLENFSGVNGRLTVRNGKNNALIIDDTYNANLKSVTAALHVLSKYKGRKIFIFGDMGELGDSTKLHHEEVGIVAKKLGIDELKTCGEHSLWASKAFGPNARHYQTQAELTDEIIEQLNQETIILVKGSRSSAMENIVCQLVN